MDQTGATSYERSKMNISSEEGPKLRHGDSVNEGHKGKLTPDLSVTLQLHFKTKKKYETTW
jgi:hypothetical protein